ncbi:tetratricopeptide repeat protein [Candidatus Uabimicrobium sp. HlEnr_7]|uniref:tetratricopeptide repeat protein n=1 Tax=Candidatus Uabimicrobium helgolandensis TaxID=3095367 RepID=UPI003555E1D8
MRKFKLLLLLSSILFITPMLDDTLYSHMSKGYMSWESSQKLGYEQISFLEPKQANLFWLYDVIVYQGYQLWGEWGWVVVATLMWTSAFILSFGFHIPLFILLSTAIYPVLTCSEHNLLFIFIALTVRFFRKNQLWYLIPLQMIWVNSHPSFVFIPFLAFILLWSQHKFRQAIYLSLVLLVCCFISPYSLSVWVPAIKANWSLTNISLFHWPVWWIAFATAFIYHIKDHKKILQAFLLLAISFIYPVWTIAAIFIYGILLEKRTVLFPKQQIILCTLFLSVFVWHTVNFKQSTSAERFKISIKKDSLSRMYNDSSCGGRLSFFSRQQVFIDKQQTYANSINNIEKIIRHNPSSFKEIANRYKFTSATIDHRLAYSTDLCRTLVESSHWSLVYCNEAIAVFLKNIPQNVDTILKHKVEDEENIKCDTQELESLYQIAQFYFRINYAIAGRKITQKIPKESIEYKLLQAYIANDDGELEQAATICSKYIENRSHNLQELQFLIATYLRTNDQNNFKKVRQWLKYAFTKYPNNIEIRFYQAQLFYLEEDYVTALSTLQKITSQYPHFRKAQQYYDSIKQNQIRVGAQEKYIKQAKLLVQKGKFRLALKRLEQSLALDKNSVEALLETGKIYHKLKKYSEAQDYYERVLRLIPKNKEGLSYLAITLTAIGKWEEAKKVIDPIAGEEVGYIQAAVSIVNDRVIRELYKQLREKYSIAVVVRLCKILAKEKRFAEAIKNFEKLSQPDKKFLGSLYYEEGKELLNNKKVEEGAKALEKAIENDPQHLEANLLIGTIFLKRKKWEKAHQHYKQVQKIDPSDPRSREGFALVELGKGYEYQAQKKFQLTVKHFKNFVTMSSDLEEKKRIQARVKDLQKSIENFKLIRLKILYEKAENAIRRKDLNRAEKLYKAIISTVANAPESYYWLAVISKERQDYQQAISYVKKAIEYRFEYHQAHELLSGLYHKTGKTDLSLKHLQIYKEQTTKE